MESIEGQIEEMTIDDNCAHLNTVADTLKDNYHIVMAFYVTCIAEGALERKSTDVYCHICEAKNKRIHACLECAFFGCFDQYEPEEGKVVSSHMKDHAMENDHYFAININHGYLFCFKCNDFVYNKIFEDIHSQYKAEATRIKGSQSFLPYMPKVDEADKLKDKIIKLNEDSYIGLRGIENIGNSCYVSCMLQVIMHTPILKDFFLRDQHQCFKRRREVCLMCEMFVMFQEFYSGQTFPFNPIPFFQSLQVFSQNAIGMDQQDTFELFQEILTGLETCCKKTHEFGNCDCLVHQMFYGEHEISRKCSNEACGNSSLLPSDTFVDIALDLEVENDSLVEILRRKYSIPELLDGYRCSNCNETTTTYKYTAIKKLPSVICFRMNCFGTDPIFGRKSRSRKIKKKSTAFEFTNSIDLSEFLNSKSPIDSSTGSESPKSSALETRYYLYGVIYHKGGRGGGHYVTYIKQRNNRWFECDDTQVSFKTLDDVLQCEPYLLFYNK